MTEQTLFKTLLNGLTGISASYFAVISTFQEQLEWWVRLSGGSLGLAVAAVTLYRLLTRKTV